MQKPKWVQVRSPQLYSIAVVVNVQYNIVLWYDIV